MWHSCNGHHYHPYVYNKPCNPVINIDNSRTINVVDGGSSSVFSSGGGFWSGFSNGFGFGIGQWLMNGLFGGGLFGGGMSMPWLGGGMWNMGGMGMPWMYGTTQYYGPGAANNSTPTKSTPTTHAECKDLDADDIHTLKDRASELLKNPGSLTRDDAKKLYDDVNNKLNNLKDKVHDDDNKKDLNRIVKSLNDIATVKRWLDLSKDEPTEVTNSQNPQGDNIVTNQGNQTPVENPQDKKQVEEQPQTQNNPGADEIQIGGKNVKIENLTAEQAKTLTSKQIMDLEPEQIDKITNSDVAQTMLETLGKIKTDGAEKYGILSNDIKVLLLLDKANINVDCATNKGARDKYMCGKITVDFDKYKNTGLISYTIECDKNVREQEFGLTYQVNQQSKNGDDYKITWAKGTDVEIPDGKTLYYKEQDYTFDSKDNILSRDNIETVITEKPKNGYEEVKKKEEE